MAIDHTSLIVLYIVQLDSPIISNRNQVLLQIVEHYLVHIFARFIKIVPSLTTSIVNIYFFIVAY